MSDIDLKEIITKVESEFPDIIPADMLKDLNIDKPLAFLCLFGHRALFKKQHVLDWLESQL